MFLIGKQVFQSLAVADIARNEGDAGRKEVAAAVAQIIKNTSLMAARSEESGNGTTNVSGSAGNENVHKKLSFRKHSGLRRVYYNEVGHEGNLGSGRRT